MKKLYGNLTSRLVIAFLLNLAGLDTGWAQVLNFQSATPAYPPKALNHTFTNVGTPPVDITVTVSGPASFGNNTPKSASTGLTNQLNFANRTEVETYTITFSKPVENLTFTLANIDQSSAGVSANAFAQDQLVLSATDGNGSGLGVNISSSPNYIVAGNVITATSATNSTASINIPGYTKQVTIQFGNGSLAGGNPGAQGFTIGTLYWSNVVLPVDLISFQAKPIGNTVQLNWQTAWERNAERFQVQRSTDLLEYVTVGELVAKGNTNTYQIYTFTDETPLDGANYYRLKQIDSDQTAILSKPVSAVVHKEQPLALVSTTPTSESGVRLRLRDTGDVVARLWTPMGQAVLGHFLDQSSQEVTWQPDHPLTSGLYIMEVVSGAARQVLKVFVQ